MITQAIIRLELPVLPVFDKSVRLNYPSLQVQDNSG